MINKRSLSFLAAGAVSLGAFSFTSAAFGQGGRFTGPDNLRQVTVAEALELPDDTNVKVQGYIVRSLGDEKYEFRDDSATIIVEIDDDDWRGFEATPDVLIELSGEIDLEREGAELEADAVRQVQ